MKTNTLNPKFHKAFNNCIKALEKISPQIPSKDIIPWPKSRIRIPLPLVEEFQERRNMREYLEDLSR
jgi:hypothetical protein